MSSSLPGKGSVLSMKDMPSLISSLALPVLTGMVFLGALLLFGMEPLAGRLLVPYFGGAVHVWLTCLMFFQAMLLVGYLYAHLFAQKLGHWHLLLLVLPLINLPLAVIAQPTPETPLFTLLAVLMAHFALPFAILSTTAVVAQSWLARSTLGCLHEPYPLYAASNAGSLVALLGYPFLIEPLMGVRAQSLAWMGGYVLYLLLVAVAWFSLRPDKGPADALTQNEDVAAAPAAAPSLDQYARWLLLSALPSAFLLTVTNFIALEVGSFPMVWVIPLALYLCSFVVTFRNNGGIPKPLAALWPEVLLVGLIVYILPMGLTGWLAVVIVPLVIFFAICLIAHGELYERRPPVRYLTTFYLTLAVGGFLGGVAISLIAPAVFSGLYEYPLTLAALAVTFFWCRPASSLAFWRHPKAVLRLGRLVGFGVIIGMIAACSLGHVQKYASACKFRHRNFYGMYRIIEEAPMEGVHGGLRKLVHGKTLHGSQLLNPKQQQTPTSYYYSGGAIADVYEVVPPPRGIAVLGLGAGVVSAYTGPSDRLIFYEIDPDNEGIARAWFTFLDKAAAPVSVVVGDGRLSMQKAGKDQGNYDIIHIDAFTGDGIPTHLLTREAMEVYLDRLAPGGLLLFHISNRYYDLRSLVKATAGQLKLHGAMNMMVARDKLAPYETPAQCIVFAREAARLQPLVARGWVPLGPGDGLKATTPWTDDYVNILSPLVAKLGGK